MEEIKKYLKEGNRQKSLCYALNRLDKNEINVIDLYDNILIPISRGIECDLNDKDICQWKAHMQNSIIRTIVENCYPYVVKKKKESNNKVSVILCPKEEYYDLEARIFSDYLLVLGYEAVFVGADTPYEDFYNIVSFLNPEVILICVDNYYNIISTKKMIDDIKKKLNNKPTIIVNGKAFLFDKRLYKTVGANYCATNYSELKEVVSKL